MITKTSTLTDWARDFQHTLLSSRVIEEVTVSDCSYHLVRPLHFEDLQYIVVA